jgi:hypothetical protein
LLGDWVNTSLAAADALTVKLAVVLKPQKRAVTVWDPDIEELQELELHEPSGEMEKAVSVVTAPRLLFDESNAVAV